MIHISKIVFKNFIPYYGIKEFDFGNRAGSSIIFGNNNTGKTSFINGIRFLFFGYLKNNPDNPNFRIKLSMNKIAFDNGDYNFYVLMLFEYNGKRYSFKREMTRDSKVIGEPTCDNDYREDIILYEDDERLSQARMREIIHQVIPENISEFMLFDGENIEKYIEILNNDSSSGVENRRVKDAINKVLGTPFIDNIIARMDTLIGETNNKLLKEIGRDTNNRDHTSEISKLSIELQSLSADKEKATKKAQDTKKEIEEINIEISEGGRTDSIIKELENNDRNLSITKGIIENRKKELKDAINNNISSMQYNKISELLHHLDTTFQPLVQRRDDIIEKKEKLDYYEDLISKRLCPVCGSNLSQEKYNEFITARNTIKKFLEENQLTKAEQEQLICYGQKRKKIESLHKSIDRFDIKNIQNILEEITMKETYKNGIENRIRELKKELGDDENDLRSHFKKLYQKKDDLEKQMRNYTEAIDQIEKDFQKKSGQIDSLKRKMQNVGNIDLLEKEKRLMIEIRYSFSEARELFISNMRTKVQNSASEIFLRFIEGNNKDIDGILINENYRMKIVMTDGSTMPIPGTGYNTLLALSLIFGLNHNSQLFGTIFFDAAFSVLQNTYTNNIIKTFSEIAPQLIMLIHNDKIDINTTRQILGANLIKEYEIYQDDSSFNTKIKEV